MVAEIREQLYFHLSYKVISLLIKDYVSAAMWEFSRNILQYTKTS